MNKKITVNNKTVKLPSTAEYDLDIYSDHPKTLVISQGIHSISLEIEDISKFVDELKRVLVSELAQNHQMPLLKQWYR